MHSEIQTNSKEDNLGSDQVHFTSAAQRAELHRQFGTWTVAVRQRQRAWASWCQCKLPEAVFLRSLMPVGHRGREHHTENPAASSVPRAQGDVARRLPQPEMVHVNFPKAENNNVGAHEQDWPSKHSLPALSGHPAVFGRERTELELDVTARTQSSHLSHRSCLHPTLTLYPKSPHHQQGITKGPHAYLSKYKLDVSFFWAVWNLRRHPQANATQTCRQHGCVRALMWEPKLKYACKAPVAPFLWLTHPKGAITCTDAMNSGALEGVQWEEELERRVS